MRACRTSLTIAAVSDLASQRLARFLEEVAEPTPAPGGGSAAAVGLGLAAALVEMAARLAGSTEAATRSSGLRSQALELAERERSSYQPVLEALRLPRDEPSRSALVSGALLEASRTPLAVAEAAAEVAELGTEVAGASSPSVRGDALTGTLLAEAAAAAAAVLVEINLERRPSAPELARAREARARAGRARAAADSADSP
jgi:methenyltetrahydrofolate cyclohydrolase